MADEFGDHLEIASVARAAVEMKPLVDDKISIRGVFDVWCVGPDGTEKWRERVENTVVTVGKNALLDNALAGSSYTVTGPYMGLISSTSFSAINAADTMSSHAGWLEAGNANTPTYTAPRKTCAWSAASSGSKALSAALAFAITGSGTVKGLFIVFGSGAVSTIDSTAGTLFCAVLFTGGDRIVQSLDTINASYTVSM